MEYLHSIILICIIVFLYLVTYFLVITKKMKELTLRRIWNTVLLFSFLVVAGIGVAMALMIDFDMYPSWYAKVLDFHIDVGIIMATVTTIHVIERAWFFDIRKWNLFNK